MPRSIGIDIAKHHLDAAVETIVSTLPNAAEGWKRLTNAMRAGDIAVMESTGGYERGCAQALREAGFGVAIVNPADVRSYRKGMGIQAKTDAIDAQILVRFGEARKLKAGPDQPNPKLAELAGRRAQLVATRAAEKNRLEHARGQAGESVRRHIEWLDGEIASLIAQTDELKHKADLLMSAPGVGKVTAMTLLAELPELGRLTQRKLASLAGLAPHARESGQWKGRRSIGRGRIAVRKAMYMAVMGGKRGDNVLQRIVRALIAAGKAPKQAIIACARKLLVALNAMLRDRATFQESLLAGSAALSTGQAMPAKK